MADVTFRPSNLPPGRERYGSRQFSDMEIDDYLRKRGVDPESTGPEKMKVLDEIGVGVTQHMPNLFGMRKSDRSYEKQWDKTVMEDLPAPPFNPVAWELDKAMGINPVTGMEVPQKPEPFVGPPTPQAVRASQNVGYKQRPWDLEHPWELSKTHGASVMNEYSLPQKVLNAWYEYGSNAAEGLTFGVAKFPHDEMAQDSAANVIAGSAGRLVGEIAGPFKAASVPGRALGNLGRKAMVASDFGGPFTRQLLHTILESGTTLGAGMALSDIKDIKGMPERFGEGFKTGLGFGAAGLISSKTSPRLFALLRQFGGRAMLTLTGSYDPNSLVEAIKTGTINPEIIYNELLQGYFLRHGRNIKDVLAVARTARGEAEALGLKGFPTDEQVTSNMREMMAGVKPDAKPLESLLSKIRETEPQKESEELKAGHEWQEEEARIAAEKTRSELQRVMGIRPPGTMSPETAPKIALDDPRIPVSGPLGPKVAPRREKPGERMFDTGEDYWEAYAGVSMKPAAGQFEKWITRQMGWKQDEQNLEKMTRIEQRDLAKDVWQKSVFTQIAKREAQGLEIGLDADEIVKFLPQMERLGRLYAKYPKLLQPVISLGRAIKPNADYWKTFDLNTNCPRRFQYAATIQAIEGKLGAIRPDRPMLSADELIGLSEMLKARGELAPCLYCYVESARRAYSEAVAKGMQDHGVDLPPELFRTKESREAFKVANPQLAGVVDKISKKAQAASMANLEKGFSAYSGDVFKITDKEWEDIDARAGLRMNSNTDFQIDQTLDYMRGITDLAVLKKKAHAFTKVPEFAKIFGNTGVKILQSLYAQAPGMEDAVEGMPWQDAMENRAKYKNVGTILVAKDDATLKWALGQDWIDMVIPYHRSGMTKAQMERLDLKDYTSVQREKWIEPDKHRLPNGKLEKAPRFEFKDHQNNLDRYLGLCEEAGVRPRFEEFLYNEDGSINEGYMKLITDEPRMEVVQEPVKPLFDWAEARKAIRKWQAEGGYNKQMRAKPTIVKEVLGQIGEKGEFAFERGPNAPVSEALTKKQAELSRKGITTSSPVKSVTYNRLSTQPYGNGGTMEVWEVVLPGGRKMYDRKYIFTQPGEDGEAKLRSEIEAELHGTFMAGVKPDLGKAEDFLSKLATEQGKAQKAPAEPVAPLKTNKRKIIQYGTGELADLEKDGIKYTGERGKGQELLDAYDEATRVREAAEAQEPLLPGVPRQYPLPDRPEGFAEIAPDAPTVRSFTKAAEEIKKGKQGWFETGLRFFERVGRGEGFRTEKTPDGYASKAVNTVKEIFYDPMKRGLDAVNKSLGKISKELIGTLEANGLSTKYDDSVEVGKYLVARQHGGTRVLELDGLSPEEAAKYRQEPPPKVKRVIDWIDDRLLKAFHEINRSRIRAGLDPIEWRKDYFTFWHTAEAMSRSGLNLVTAAKETIDAKFAEYERWYENDLSTRQAEFRAKSRFSKWMFQKRSGKLGPVDLDAYGVFTKYMHSAYEQMYLAEAQSVMKKLVDGSWEIDGKKWSLGEANKTLKESLSNYMGFIATGTKPGEMPKEIFETLNKLGRNVAVGKVGANFKSSLNQLTSNVHSWSVLGTKYWAKGLASYGKGLVEAALKGKVEGGEYMRAREEGDLATRRREIAFEEFMRRRPRTALGRGFQRAGELGMAPLQALDMVTAEITWRGAYERAMDGEVSGLPKGNHEYAVDFANETVTRTQGSTMKTDITPFQRGQWGKVFSVLQNFVINEWGFVTRDVMGIKDGLPYTKENAARTLRFVIGAMILDWLYEDELGIKSPFNVIGNPMQIARPVAAEYKKSGNVLKAAGEGVLAAAETLPIIGRGFSPYGVGGGVGGGAALETVTEVKDVIRHPKASKAIDWAGSLAGVPGSYPASRAIRILEKGGDLGQALVGAEPAEKSKKDLVYDRETGTWKAKPRGGGKKKAGKYNRETGQWEY